ncbi:MAG TPA: F0F1 ATP synthase subunit B [Alphaproteobacteria bacterium]|nr:F0F1 ATP synthase subunit B [Alphaproteobacteria bacterium]
MWHDPMFWSAVAFLCFLALFWRYVRKPMYAWLDHQIAAIREQFGHAQKLRAEAEATLAEYKAKHAAAMQDAEEIVRRAHEEAARLKTQAEAELKDVLARREQEAMERIRLAETEAAAAVRVAAVDAAMTIAREKLAAQIGGTEAATLADQAIAEMPKLGTVKAGAV